jgi:hypothetical protein
MGALEKGDRVRITGFGPQDSWSRTADEDMPTPLNRTGELIEILTNLNCTEGYISCVIQLDEPLLNYLVRITLFEAKLERIDDGQGINTCESKEG